MAKLSEQEQRQLDALTAKKNAPDEAEETVLLVKRGDREYTLRGRSAERALREFFGDADPDASDPAGKGDKGDKGRTRPGKGDKTPPAPPPPPPADDDQGDDDDEDDQGDDDEDDEESDPAHTHPHWYFGRA